VLPRFFSHALGEKPVNIYFSTKTNEELATTEHEKLLQALLEDPYQNEHLATLCDAAADYVYGHWNDKV